AAGQIEHGQGQQRTVGGETGGPLRVTAVRGVVGGAVGVGGGGAEPEKQRFGRPQAQPPGVLRPRDGGAGGRGRAARGGPLARPVDDVLFLDQTDAAALPELLAFGDEQQLAAAAPLGGDGGQTADPFRRFAQAQGRGELAAAAGEHATASGDGREETGV